MSTSSKPQLTDEEIQELQAKFTRFRILVIGRANAGKTTILRRLCDTAAEPLIFSPDGEKIESSALNPSLGRGEHDIKNQMIFESNPGFIFHDSPGFEAGSAQELKLVQEFIKERSKATNVNEQLHAIWYCIPTSDDRPITVAERKFFNECGTGLVPVILLWTKTDSLDLAKIKQLLKEGNSKAEAMRQAPQKAWTDFEQSIHESFEEFKYPPKGYVMFRNMHEPGADFKDLIEKTTAALSSEELRQLFLSTQQNNIELCIAYGIRRVLNDAQFGLKSLRNKDNGAYLMGIVLGFFPQFHICTLGIGFLKDDEEFQKKLEVLKWKELQQKSIFPVSDRMNRMNSVLDRMDFYALGGDDGQEKRKKTMKDLDFTSNREIHCMISISNILSSILSGLSTKISLKESTYCAIVAAILGHLSFFIHKESPNETGSLERAVQVYQQSTCDSSVKQAVETIFKLETFFEDPYVNFTTLSEEAIQVALNNIISRK